MMRPTLLTLIHIKLSGCDHFTKSYGGYFAYRIQSLIWLYVVVADIVYTMSIHHFCHIAFFTLGVLPNFFFQIDLIIVCSTWTNCHKNLKPIKVKLVFILDIVKKITT